MIFLVVLTRVGMIVLVGQTDSTESVLGHRLNHILHDVLLVLNFEGLGLTLTVQYVVTPGKTTR